MKPWVLYALLTLLSWGVWGFFSKLASNQTRPRQILLFQAAGALAFALLVLTLERFRIQWSTGDFAWSFAGGFVNFVGFLVFFAAIEKGKVSTIITMTSLYPVVTIVLSAIFLHERLTKREGIGVVLALIAGWLIAA
jgi:transporter family protein